DPGNTTTPIFIAPLLLGKLDYSSSALAAPDFAPTLLAAEERFAGAFGRGGGLAAGDARGASARMAARDRGSFSFRLAALFPLRGCGRWSWDSSSRRRNCR